MKRSIGYVRVSTQAQGEKFGVEAQKQAISEYAEKNGYEIIEWLVDTISGTTESRPQFDRILLDDEISNPPIEAVIVFKSDRVARDIKLFFYFEFLLQKKGVELVSVNDGFPDVADEYKNIIKSFVLFSAEQERANITRRTRSGRIVKASKGGYAGGKPPYGYYVSDGRLLIKEEEAKIVRWIFALANNRMSQKGIAKKLNYEGVKTKTGKSWTNVQVANVLMLENLYRGLYRYGNGEFVKGQQEPILKEKKLY